MSAFRTLKSRLFERDGNLCVYCKKMLNRKTATVDHVFPKSRGGTKHINNSVLACESCNNKKGNQNILDFIIEENVGHSFLNKTIFRCII